MNVVINLLFAVFLLSGMTSSVFAQWRQIPGTEGEGDAVIAVDDQYIYAGAHFGSLRRTADSGRTWEYVNTGLPDSSIFVTMYDEPGLLLLGTGKGAFRSTDHGEHWQPVADSITKGKTVHQFHRYGRFVFMACDSALAQSSDEGVTWNKLTVPIKGPQGYFSLASFGDHLLVGMEGDGIYRSVDSGLTWTFSNVHRGGELVFALCDGDGYSLAAGVVGGVLYRSTDNGLSWANIDTSLHRALFQIMTLAVYGGRFAIAGGDLGIYISDDKGIRWADVNDGLPFKGQIDIVAVCLSNSEIFIASSQSGCFRRPLSELITPPSSVEDATTGAAATRLGQSIPNPTNGEVMIPYSLAASGHVSITLYNSLLQQVATVVDAEEPSGPHTARLDASALPPGAYYYRLHAGSVNLTRQMIIVR